MTASFEITNEDLFNELVIDVDTTGLKRIHGSCFYGSLAIELDDNEGWFTITGEFGEDDYSEMYGFKLIKI